MSKNTLIFGKIASVISDISVVINRGSSHGVTEGMKFTVYIEVGPIDDPDDPSNMIHNLSYKKGTIEATTVLEKMSICSIEGKWEEQEEDDYGRYSMGKTVRPAVESPLIRASDLLIKTGDLVKQVSGTPQGLPEIHLD